MKIKIERGVKKGIVFRKFYFDGIQSGTGLSRVDISRKLTGTTGEDGSGIFEDGLGESISFAYGDFESFNIFDGLPGLDYDRSATDIHNVLKERINRVRAWVNGIDFEESIEFEVL
jgi:hypothetical protein